MALRSQIVPLVQGDFGNVITIRLRDRKTRQYLDLTGVETAQMFFRSLESGGEPLFVEELEVGLPKWEGRLLLRFTEGNLDIPEGRYEGEVELNAPGNKLTPYEKVQFRLREDVA